ncbi:MAG: TonB-dependent receptor [Rhodanobacteraceae bacterium]|nr:TonB-dependent receptor [Rhodanobacteraceae bacterium]
MRPLLHPLAAALAALCCSSAHALPEPSRLDAITVEGHAPAELPSAEALGADELARKRAATSDTAALLLDLPGVSAWGAGGVSSLPAIRGLADDRLRIQVDGTDLLASCPNHMNPPLSYVAPSQVSAVKVYAGITPVSVGGDSIGGSIVLETAAPRFAIEGADLVTGGELATNYRSNGDAFGVDAAFTLASEQFHLGYTGALAEGDNYRAGGDFKPSVATGREGHTLPLDEVGSSAYRTRNHQLTAGWRSGAHLVDARIGLQDMPFQNFPNQRMDLTDNRAERFNLHYRGQLERLTLDARVWHEAVEHAMDFGADRRYWYGMASNVPGASGEGRACSPVSYTCAAGMPMRSDSRNNGGKLAAEFALGGEHLLRIGGELHAYRLDDYWPASGGGMWPGVFVNINGGERDRSALYSEWEGSFGERWTHLVGLRFERVASDSGDVRGYDTDAAPPGSYMMTAAEAAAFNARSHDRSDDNLDLAALARYQPGETFDVEFGLARKTRSPNLYERYTWSSWSMAAAMNNTVGDGNGYVGNLDLVPEVAYTVSASFDWHAPDAAWRLRASPWITHVDDYIDARRVSNTANAFNVLRYANQSARLHGLDVDAGFALGETAAGRFDLDAIAGWTRGRNRDTDEDLYQIMPPNARLALRHTRGGWENALELVVVGRKDRVNAVRNEIATPGYGLVNLRLAYTVGQWRFDAGVENLLDRRYRLPQGGAYLGQGATMMLNGVPYGIAVPGPGRNWYAGVRVTF